MATVAGGMSRKRGGLGLSALALVLAACGANGANGDSGARGAATISAVAEPSVPPSAAPSPAEAVPSGLAWAIEGSPRPEGLPEPLLPLEELRSGGPPPDGIPSIDEPKFLTASAVDFLADTEPVLAVEIDGDARAYPVQVLVWHEIVNDTVGDVPVAVTYCPLCNSAVGYDRRVGDRVLEFGTSGLLWNSALIMYDRQTETLWSHFTGEGVVGILTGTELETFPVATVAWGTWRAAHPDGLVLSTETGFNRDYGRNPYPGYDDVDGRPFLYEGEVDGRFTAMTRVVGISSGDAGVAVPLVELQGRGVIPVVLDGRELVVMWAPGTASALDAGRVADGADVGASGVFVPEAEGRPLTFEATGGRVVDVETGSTWDILGSAVDGPLAGARLERVEHVDTFWFAWSAFLPDTDVAS